MRLRALPLSEEVEAFIAQNDRVYVVEQNRDGQLLDLLRSELFAHSLKLRSVRHYDGLPLHAISIVQPILQLESGKAWATNIVKIDEAKI